MTPRQTKLKLMEIDKSITDLANEPREAPQKMPDVQFQLDGRPETMRTYLVEPGAVSPATPAQAAGGPPPPTPQPQAHR